MSRAEDDGFLGRWSRLKRDAAKPEPAPEPGPEAGPEAGLGSAVPPADSLPPEPAPLSDEDLAALPKIEDLAEGSDIRAFLRAGVPRQLRNAAMRRMWMLTPAIRDYRDPAVDYAWDWNTPGGVPGDGVAPTAERAAEMLRDLFAPRGEVASERPAPDARDTEDAAPVLSAASNGTGSAPSPDEGEVAAHKEAEAAHVEDTEAAPDPIPRRRHGSALPG